MWFLYRKGEEFLGAYADENSIQLKESLEYLRKDLEPILPKKKG